MRHFVIAGILVIVATFLTYTGLVALHVMPVNASVQATEIDWMWNLMEIAMSFLFALIVVPMFYSLVVFRRKKGDTTDAAHIEGHLATFGIEPTAVRRYWLHQANQGMNELVMRKLVGHGTSADVAPLILDTWANTASAGSIIAFHEHRADLKPGDLGVICSFGAGYSVGSVIVRRC